MSDQKCCRKLAKYWWIILQFFVYLGKVHKFFKKSRFFGPFLLKYTQFKFVLQAITYREIYFDSKLLKSEICDVFEKNIIELCIKGTLPCSFSLSIKYILSFTQLDWNFVKSNLIKSSDLIILTLIWVGRITDFIEQEPFSEGKSADLYFCEIQFVLHNFDLIM